MRHNVRVLVIEDDRSMLRIMEFALTEAGYEVSLFANGQDGWEEFTARHYDLVVTDLMLPGIDGLQFLRRAQQLRPDSPVVMITAHGNIETAVTAMKDGAYDFIAKPFHPDALVNVVRRGLEYQELRRENRQLRDWAGSRLDLEKMIYVSPAMDRVVAEARNAAGSDAGILILGESGTGKEVLARAIHAGSLRRDKPFVAVACGALPANLIESELFGHAKGAFTGATSSHDGKFLMANGGTLFLDEIGELPLELQPKLLRALQEREIERVGENTPVPVDARVIAATHRPLEQMVAAGEFREDLFYRLNIIPLALPPLRQRREDIPLLWEFFTRETAAREGVRPFITPPEVLEHLTGAAWPGNIRELENLAMRLVVLYPGKKLAVEDIPQLTMQVSGSLLQLPETGLDLAGLERDVIRQALARHGGNQTMTAKYLNISRPTLLYRMQKYDLR